MEMKLIHTRPTYTRTKENKEKKIEKNRHIEFHIERRIKNTK